MPDEAMSLPPDEALVFVAGHSPIRGKKIRYYEDPEFARRAAIPPPEVSDRVRPDAPGKEEGESANPGEDALRLVEVELPEGETLFPEEDEPEASTKEPVPDENAPVPEWRSKDFL